MFLDELKHVELLFLDVDGVLTDGSLLITESGEQLRIMNIKDGYALQLAVKQGLQICIISGGKSEGVVKRLNGLGITDVHIGIKDKLACLHAILKDKGIKIENTLYMGDDMPDVPVMKICQLAACPQDAIPEVKEIAHYISPFAGGKGCVRDVIEKILKLQGKWYV